MNQQLVFAASRNNWRLVDLFLAKRADANWTDNSGQSALAICRAKVLIDNADDAGKSPLHESAQDGYVDVCRLLLESRAEADKTNIEGRTPMHMSADQGHDEVCRLLHQSRADPQSGRQ